MPITYFRSDDDDERVDGRDLRQPSEPGSDALLLLGLLMLLRRLNPMVGRPRDE